jgi:hypothetical protein
MEVKVGGIPEGRFQSSYWTEHCSSREPEVMGESGLECVVVEKRRKRPVEKTGRLHLDPWRRLWVTMIPTPTECTARRSRASTETAPDSVKLGPTVSKVLTALHA